MPNIPVYVQIIMAIIGVIFFFWFWMKFSPLRSLLAALVNTVYGIVLFSTLTAGTPGFTIIFVVAAILTIFGIWGLVLWVKHTVSHYQDQTQTEAILSWWQTIRAFNIILIIGIALRIFIIQPFVVEGPSMENNFINGEMILVDKISYHLRQPARGEVLIFKAPKNPEDDYIKRLIGLPGETVIIDRGKIYVNNQLVNESFLSSTGKTPENSDPIQIKLGLNEYFVLGDNRPHSSDSREWGAVPKENIVGRAIVSFYPIDMFGTIKTPDLGVK